MSCIIYETTPQPRRSMKFDFENADANAHWARHYSNYLLLDWIAKHQHTSFEEKSQARQEIIIAQRKLDWWKKHPNFDAKMAEHSAATLKAPYKSPTT